MREKANPWDEIYTKRGEVQHEPVECVRQAMEYLKSYNPLRIADVGCGTGRHGLYIAQQIPWVEIYGFDNSPKALAIFEKHSKELSLNGRINLQTGDFDESMPIPDQVESIVATLSIHHGNGHQLTERFKKLQNHLTPGGIFVFSGPSVEDARFATGYSLPEDPFTKYDTAQYDGALPHHFFDADHLSTFFPGYKLLYLVQARRPMVMAQGEAVNLEVIYQKPY